MNETIFLNKNNSIRLIKNFQKSFSKHEGDINYVLFPINLYTDSFILHKPMKYMNHFTKAIIKFESVIVQDSYIMEDYGDCFSIINEIAKEMNDVVSFIQYLHSLNRIRYCNKLADTNESVVVERTEFTLFQLDIYQNDTVIYSLDMNLTNQRGHFGANEILENISSIYHPIELKEEYSYIEIGDEWRFVKNISNNIEMIYGVFLPRTKSFTFFNEESIKIMKCNIKDIYFYTATFNPETMEKEECYDICIDPNFYHSQLNQFYPPLRFQDLWTHEIADMVEYITYLTYIYSNSIAISEINDYGEPINTYKTLTSIEINTFDRPTAIEIKCDSDQPITINQIIEYLIS